MVQPKGRIPATRIDHVAVIVRDADAAIEHFEDAYALRKSVDWTDPAGRFRLVYMDCGDTVIQLVQPLASQKLAEHLASNGEGLHHVCFAVDDFDHVVRGLDGKLEDEPYLGGKGWPVCFLSDPSHGVMIELTGAPQTGTTDGSPMRATAG